ncbi:MAG: hypothetical protein ABR889_00705 [Acidobacteriaceae bacterium]
MSKSRVVFSSAFLALSALFASTAPMQTAAPRVARVTVNQPVTFTDGGRPDALVAPPLTTASR